MQQDPICELASNANYNKIQEWKEIRQLAGTVALVQNFTTERAQRPTSLRNPPSEDLWGQFGGRQKLRLSERSKSRQNVFGTNIQLRVGVYTRYRTESKEELISSLHTSVRRSYLQVPHSLARAPVLGGTGRGVAGLSPLGNPQVWFTHQMEQ